MAWGVTANMTPESGLNVSGHQLYESIASVLATHAAWEAVDSYVSGSYTYHVWKNLAASSGLPYDWYVSFYHDNAYGVGLMAIMHEKYTVGTRTAEWYFTGPTSFTPVYDSTTEMWHHSAASVWGGTTQAPAPTWTSLNNSATNLQTAQVLVTNSSIIGSFSYNSYDVFYFGKFDSIVNKVPDPMPIVAIMKNNGSYTDVPTFTNAPGATAVASSYWLEIPNASGHSPLLRQTISSLFGTLGTVVPGTGLDNFLYGAVMSRLWVEYPGGPNYTASSQSKMRGLLRDIYQPGQNQRTYSVGTTLLLDGRVFAHLGNSLWVDTEAT